MNKFVCALIAVICTIISVGTMLYNNCNLDKGYLEEENSISYSTTKEDKINFVSENVNNNITAKETGENKVKELEKINSGDTSDEIKDKNIGISEESREKIISAAKKLSPIDYEKTLTYLSSENNREGITEAIKLLKGRLTDSDYEKIKVIGDIFIR